MNEGEEIYVQSERLAAGVVVEGERRIKGDTRGFNYPLWRYKEMIMITLFKVIFLAESHEGVTVGKLSNAYKWKSFFKNKKTPPE